VAKAIEGVNPNPPDSKLNTSPSEKRAKFATSQRRSIVKTELPTDVIAGSKRVDRRLIYRGQRREVIETTGAVRFSSISREKETN
jgi:hypothetical protein